MKNGITENEMRQALGLAPVKRARTKDAARPDRTVVKMSVRRNGGMPFVHSHIACTPFHTEAVIQAKHALSEDGLEFWCLLEVGAEQ